MGAQETRFWHGRERKEKLTCTENLLSTTYFARFFKYAIRGKYLNIFTKAQYLCLSFYFCSGPTPLLYSGGCSRNSPLSPNSVISHMDHRHGFLTASPPITVSVNIATLPRTSDHYAASKSQSPSRVSKGHMLRA